MPFVFYRFILVLIHILRGYKLYPDLNKPEKPLVRTKVFSHAIEMMHHPVSSRILCLNRALGLCFSFQFQLMWWQGCAHGRLDSGTKHTWSAWGKKYVLAYLILSTGNCPNILLEMFNSLMNLNVETLSRTVVPVMAPPWNQLTFTVCNTNITWHNVL